MRFHGPCNFGASFFNRTHEQVIAPLLIILRVTDRRQLASGAISGTIASIRFGQGGSGGGSGTILEQYPASPPDS
jgi:hypothetical protein